MNATEKTVRAAIKHVAAARRNAERRARVRDRKLRELVVAGARAGIEKTELAELAGVSRWTIHSWLGHVGPGKEHR